MGKLIFIKSNTEILSVDTEDLSHIDYDSIGTISLFFEIYQLGELATAEVKLTVKEGYEKEAINDISVIAKNASVATFSNLTRYSNQIDNKGNRAVLPAIQASRYVLSVESISYINSAGPGTGVPSGGETGQFLRKTSDTDYETEWSDVHTMYITVRNVDTGILYKGTPVHATGVTGNTPDVVAADASSAALMPATYVLNENINAGAQGQAIITGELTGVDTSLFDPGDVVYVAAGGGFTNVKPTGANLIQNLGIVTKSNANTGSGVVYGAGRSNDIPNLPNGKFFIGSAANTVESAYTLPVTDGSSGQILTTDGSGAVTFQDAPSGDLVDDLTPQLGGDLDVNGYKIVSSSNGNIVLDPDGTGNVGIGTSSPLYTLHVNDGATSSDTIFVNSYNRIGWTGGARQWLEGWSSRIAFKGGNEGEFARFSGSGGVNRLNVARALHLSASSGDNGDVRFTRLDVGKVAIGNNADDASGTLVVGNVGIGTTTPSEKLDVSGSIKGDLIYQGTTPNANFTNVGISTSNQVLASGGVNLYKQVTVGHNPFVGFKNNTDGSSIEVWSNTAYMTFGGVGGSTNSLIRLHSFFNPSAGTANKKFIDVNPALVRGASYSGNVYGIYVNPQINPLDAGTGEFYSAYFGGGNVGIGTTSPSSTLHVVGSMNLNDGSNNVLISSQNSTITASNTTAVGYQALTALTTGTGNTAVGYQAGKSTSTGGSNVAVGYLALANATTQQRNTAVGYGAFDEIIAGDNASYNTGLGYAVSSGRNSYTIVIGHNIGATGSNSVSIGGTAGYLGVTIGDSAKNGRGISIGHGAGQLLQGSIDHNIFIGNQSGYNGNGCIYNTFIGQFSGRNLSGGNNNVLLGYQSGYNIANGSNNIFLGYQAGYNETGSNKLYIENSNSSTPLIYGEFDNDLVRVNGKFEADSVTIDDEGMSAAGDYGKGAEIWYQGTSTVAAGYCYMLDSSGNWASAQANAVGTTQGMLAISAGTDSDVDGMVVRGFVQLANNIGGSVGDIVYLNESSAGRLSTTKPTGAGNFVRRVGYLVKGLNTIYFNPSNEYEAL